MKFDHKDVVLIGDVRLVSNFKLWADKGEIEEKKEMRSTIPAVEDRPRWLLPEEGKGRETSSLENIGTYFCTISSSSILNI